MESLLRQIWPLMAALAAATCVYLARERRRRRMRIAPPRPHVRMHEISARADLLEIERASLASDDPRAAFRRAAIEQGMLALYLEAIAERGAPEATQLAAFHGEAWQALREYLRLKYDDAVRDDWFDRFMGMARPYIREKVRYSQEFEACRSEGAAGYAQIYDDLLAGLAADAIAAPQKVAFVPPDLSHS